MNLERSLSHGLQRGSKVHDGLGATGLPGRHEAGAGGDGGFLSVLAALDTAAGAGPFDPTVVVSGPQGGLDTATLPMLGESALPDAVHRLPDAVWQGDTAALLAHLNRSSQWSPTAGPTAQPSAGVGLPAEVALNSATGQHAVTANQSVQLAAPVTVATDALVGASAAPAGPIAISTPAAVRPVLASETPGVPSPAGANEVQPSHDLQPAVSREEPDVEATLMPARLGSTSPRSSATSVVSLNRPLADAGHGVAAETSLASPLAVGDDAKGRRRDAAQLLTQRAEVEMTKPAVSPNGFAQTASDTKAKQTLVAADLAAQVATEPSATALMGVSEGFGRKAERILGKPTGSHVGGISEGQWGPYALVSGRPVEAPSATQNGALPTPEMMVAEQVSYWIAGKVQNAELRLDVFGKQPVDVSISMKGGEAQVEFRTDQPEVRQVLEGAVTHLKDLLKEEGLSLAGVFVGSSGQQRQGAHPSPGRPVDAEVRQARVDVAEAATSASSLAGRPVPGRSVDLFV